MEKVFSLRESVPSLLIKVLLMVLLSLSFIETCKSAFLEEGNLRRSTSHSHASLLSPDDRRDVIRSFRFSDRDILYGYTLFGSVGLGISLSTLFGDLDDNLYAMIPCVLGCTIPGSIVGHMVRSHMSPGQFMENYSHLVGFMMSLFPWLILSSLEYARFQSGQLDPFIR